MHAGRRRRRTLAPICALVLLAVLLSLAGSGARAFLEGLEPERHERPPIEGPRKKAWEQAHGGVVRARPELRRRLAGWPTRLLVDRSELPDAEPAFLERLARDTWRGLSAFVDREHALPIDHVIFGDDSLDPLQARIGDYASTTNIGLYLISVVSARELGLITPAEALERARRTLDTVERLESWHGFLFNFYDTTTLERTSDFVSFVDSSWLTAGLMVTRQSFPELELRCSALLAQRDFGIFYDRSEGRMIHGFYLAPLRRSRYHYGTLYTEARLGSLIAIGKGDVPREHWLALGRGKPSYVPAGLGETTLARHVPPERTTEGDFEWRGVRYVPSWGGSMFEALMPTLVLDELHLAPASFGRNARAHVEVQRRYALEHLGYPVWGMSPSWRPQGDAYGEYGVRVLGTAGYAAGAVTPYAAALALLVAPEAAAADLQELARRYDLYGDYGFYDAVDPVSGQVVHAYLTLDQAMILIALADHLRDGVIQQRFAADPIARHALPLVRAEHFFDAPPSPPPGDVAGSSPRG